MGTQTSRSPRLARLNGLMDKRIAKAREVLPEAQDGLLALANPGAGNLLICRVVLAVSGFVTPVSAAGCSGKRSDHFCRDLCRFATRC